MTKVTLVPTPIGNLADISLRALDVLKNADLIAAEDTRHSRILLNHHQIDKTLVRLDSHTITERAPQLLAEYNQIAYITDAGTPGISDPGAELVRLALERNVEIEVLPGATAFVPALVLSGLATNRFCFEGFLPRKGSERNARLAYIAESQVTSIIYESPHRLKKTIEELIGICGESRLASISRELSKKFETTYRGTLKELSETLPEEIKGEIVVVVSPKEQEEKPDFEARAFTLAADGLQGKGLRKALMDMGASRNEAYDLSLKYS